MSIVYTEITLTNMMDVGNVELGYIKAEYPMAGPVEIRWKNRHMIGEALVLPEAPDVLLGAMVLEHMDLTINPQAEAEGFGRELVGVHGDKEIHRV